MAALSTYFNQLWQRQATLATKLGGWLPGLNVEPRIILACGDASQAILLKLLVDKGLITDAELVAAFSAASLADFTAVDETLPSPRNVPP